MGAFAFFTFATHLILIKSGHRLIAFLLAVGCGISRIYLAQHFLSDVLLGALIGWMIGYGMFRLYLFRK
jgi:membrane-associated phospholipid phosphatase